MTSDVTTSEIRISIVEAIEIELETVRVRTERAEPLVGMLRQEAEHRVHQICDEADHYNSSMLEVHKEILERMRYGLGYFACVQEGYFAKNYPI